jgi:hypothetical protein
MNLISQTRKVYGFLHGWMIHVDGTAERTLSISEQHIKKSHRIDFLWAATFITLMLIADIYLNISGFFSSPRGIPMSIVIIWILLIFVIIILWVKGLTECDLIINSEGIQLPRSKLRTIDFRPKIRKYNAISHVEIIRHTNELGREFQITLSFKDGYSGMVNLWELRNAGLTKDEIKEFKDFIERIKKSTSSQMIKAI